MSEKTADPGLRRELLRTLLRARAWEQLEGSGAGAGALVPAVPAALALRRRSDGTGDVFSARRGTGAAALALGLSPVELLRQRRGLATARASGRDPGAFPRDADRGLIAPVETPGTLVGVMAGVALAFALRGDDRVALLVDDVDGAASGFWHEGLNFAAVRRAPFVLVVDATRRRPETMRIERIGDRAGAYGIEATAVEAGDPGLVLDAVTTAVGRAREGRGTQLVEVTGAPERDPLAGFVGRLQWAEVVSPAEARTWAEEAATEMEAARDRVRQEPAAGPDHALAPVYPSSLPSPTYPS